MLQIGIGMILLAATALLVAGCGGSSKASSTASPATTATTTASQVTGSQTTTSASTTPTAQTPTGGGIKVHSGRPLASSVWIARADTICSHALAKLGSTTIKGQQDFARLLPQAASYEHIEAIELSKLVPPAARVTDWNQIVTAMQQYAEYTSKMAAYAQAKKFNEASPLIAVATTTKRQMRVIARRVGLKSCAEA